MKILVTGASGFIGRALVPALSEAGHEVVAPSRKTDAGAPALEEPVSYLPFMAGVDALIHLAAHNPPRWKGRTGNAKLFRTLNVEATAALGRMAADAGVRKFIFLSSARVYGTSSVQPCSEEMSPDPVDPYGASKAEAERLLGKIFAESHSDLAVLRAPVVYDRGRGGVLGLLARFVRHGLPFPGVFSSQPKSVLFRRNLVSALIRMLEP